MSGRWLPGIVLAALLFAASGSAAGQQVDLQLGIEGAVVVGAWNPLRLTLRDVPAATLELRLDQGSLRSGPIVATYAVRLEPSRGLAVHEDDLFVPEWRSLTWTLRTADRTLASGSLDARNRDDRPLTLLVSTRPGRWLSHLPSGSRAVDVPGSALPARAAAHAGVAAVLIDGTAPAPTTEAVAAAAAAGAVVVLVEPLPASHAGLRALASGGAVRLGAGWIARSEAEGVADMLTRLAPISVPEATAALLAGDRVEGPPVVPTTLVMGSAAAYATLVLVLLRFGGAAGPPAAFALALVAAAAAWQILRPPTGLQREDTTLTVAAGGLALTLPTTALRSLPGGTITIERPARLLAPGTLRLDPATTSITLRRWQAERLAGRPALALSALAIEDGVMVNGSDLAMVDVVVVGTGPQPPLAPREARAPVAAEEERLPAVYERLVELLPPGAVLARQGRHIHLALPPREDNS